MVLLHRHDDTTPESIRTLPKLATNCTIVRVRALCTPIPRCQVRPGSIRAGELDRAPANAHPGPNALELADAARPDVHTTRVNGSGVSVVLMVSLQRFWKADLTAGATKG